MKRKPQNLQYKNFKKFKFDEVVNLPIYKYKEKILNDMKNSDTYIVISTTGSGKTTQIPKFLFTNGINQDKMIGISQPRRIAATSIATRVAEEMNCPLGELVGYRIRFEHKCSEKTKIKFMTDGMLIRESINDPQFSAYSIIILDEVHERSLNSDMLFGIVKNAQRLRQELHLSPLKIIIMSATINPVPFINFFGGNTKFLCVNTNAHTLTVKLMKEITQDYVECSASLCVELHIGKIPVENIPDFSKNTLWSILIFLTGEEEIKRCCNLLEKYSENLIVDSKNGLLVRPLYSALSNDRQKLAVTGNTDDNKRSVIVSTNIAETSITIPGVRVVIDCGFSKQKFFNPLSGLESLKICPISHDKAEQRAGRASRLGPGSCFRLYTQLTYLTKMPKSTQPELLRSSLLSVVLTIFGYKIPNVRQFPWLDQPDEDQITRALQQLLELRAIEPLIDENQNKFQNQFQITELGRFLQHFPIDPRYSYAILESTKPDKNCLADVTALVSILSVTDKLYCNGENSKIDSSNENRNSSEFYSRYGDLVSLLTMFREFNKLKASKNGGSISKSSWCEQRGIKVAEMNRAIDINTQLKDICRGLGLPMTTCRNEVTNFIKCFLKPFGAQIAHRTVSSTKSMSKKLSAYSTEYSNARLNGVKLQLHPTSILCKNNVPAGLVLYLDCVETDKVYMKYVSEISRDWLD